VKVLRRVPAAQYANPPGITRPAERADHPDLPGHDQLHHYWTQDPDGLAQWADHPHPYTALYQEILKHVHEPAKAHAIAAAWYHDVFHHWPAEGRGGAQKHHRAMASSDGPKAAGLAVLAADTARALMLQRAMSDDDPAAGKWEFPGGGIEPGEAPESAARREWSEETGCQVPNGQITGSWTSPNGVYCGYVLTIPAEAEVPIFEGRGDVTNPDDPDGDQIEALAWWNPFDLLANPAVRIELANDLGWVLGALITKPSGRTDWTPELHPRNPANGKFTDHPGGGFARRMERALNGQAALDATPAKLRRAPEGHYGNYEGEGLDGPAGMGAVRALSEYEGPDYQQTNTFLRGGYRDPRTGKKPTGHEDFLEGTPERIAEIDKTMAVSRLQRDVRVDRAMRHGYYVFGDAWYGDVMPMNEKDFDKQDRDFERWESGVRPDLTGLRWTDPAYQSTTADPKVAASFGKRWPSLNTASEGEPVIIHMLVPAGTGGVQLAEMGHAAEILLERGLTMEVQADHGVGEDGFRHLDVAVVTDGNP
jgi:8-oxo-dGTP pyrophosphatase MutT (NUDIX family)